jgi:large subunit ribosomal protein L29
MTGKEARDMTPEQVAAELVDLRRKLFSLRTQAVTEKVEDNSQFPKIRRDIARLLTVQRERAAGQSTKPAAAERPAPRKKSAGKPVAKAPKADKPQKKKERRSASAGKR